MSIRPIQARLTITDAAFAYASELVDLSAAAATLATWISEDDCKSTTAPRRRARPAYSPRALLIGLALLVHTRQPVSWAALLQLFWCQLEQRHLDSLGLTDVMDKTRLDEFRSLAAGGSETWSSASVRRLHSEYARLVRSLDTMFDCVRFSPHDRKGKRTNLELKQVLENLTEEQRNLLAHKAERHATLMNDIVAASVDRVLLARHKGDIMFDEVVIQVAKVGNTGTKDHKRHAGNPDAVWFTKGKKGKKETPRWAHGATFIMTSQRPTEESVPALVVGMSFGAATGGSVADTVVALDQAVRTEMLANRTNTGKRSRYAIADMGFTLKNGMNRALVDRGYYLLQDHPKGQNLRRSLAEGPVLFNDVIICPGFGPSTKQPFPRLEKTDTEQARIRHKQREEHLLAGRMKPNGRPEPATQAGRGRPRKDAAPSNDMRVEVGCPAAAKECRCTIVPESLSLPATTPDVPAPPLHDLPPVCKKTFSSLLLDEQDFKYYGVHLFAGAEHEHLYSHARSLNEQWHSLLRAEHTGGMEAAFFNSLGIERIGVILALAVAETNAAMQRSFTQRKVRTALAA